MSSNEDPRTGFLKELIQRADSDPAFRQLLLSDPRAALQQAFDIQVPDEVTVQVLEERADHVYIVLPASGRGDDAPGEDFQGRPDTATFGCTWALCPTTTP